MELSIEACNPRALQNTKHQRVTRELVWPKGTVQKLVRRHQQHQQRNDRLQVTSPSPGSKVECEALEHPSESPQNGLDGLSLASIENCSDLRKKAIDTSH